MIPEPAEGEGYSTGRGGAANVHPQGAHAAEKPAATNGLTGGSRVARLGLAYDPESKCVTDFLRDKLKYKLFRKKPPVKGN